MLSLHIGMPKTGSTAIQGYLRAHQDLLEHHGSHYMITGRDRGTGENRLVCHNSMAMNMIRNWINGPQDQHEAFRREYDTYRDSNCILSSEMFFGRDLRPLHDRFLQGLGAETRVIVYLRRFDDFVEADYKQRVKKSRKTGANVHDFMRNRLERARSDTSFLNFAQHFDDIREAIPGAQIVPRIYLRDELVGRDVITDFMSILGVPEAEVTVPKSTANRTLSRLAAEALGVFDDSAGVDGKRKRRLDRALQALDDPKLMRSGDVLTWSERTELNDLLEERNAAMRKEFFPDRDRLFPVAVPKAGVPERGHPDELDEFRYAVHEILKLLANGY